MGSFGRFGERMRQSSSVARLPMSGTLGLRGNVALFGREASPRASSVASPLPRLPHLVDKFRLHLVAVAQRRAGIGDDDLAFPHAFADLDRGVGRKADAHA